MNFPQHQGHHPGIPMQNPVTAVTLLAEITYQKIHILAKTFSMLVYKSEIPDF